MRRHLLSLSMVLSLTAVLIGATAPPAAAQTSEDSVSSAVLAPSTSVLSDAVANVVAFSGTEIARGSALGLMASARFTTDTSGTRVPEVARSVAFTAFAILIGVGGLAMLTLAILGLPWTPSERASGERDRRPGPSVAFAAPITG